MFTVGELRFTEHGGLFMNKAMLMGRLTRDPELRHIANNSYMVCSFTLAIDRKYTKQGEEKQTDFIPVVAWNKNAEFCSRYFKKGQKVVVIGRIQVRTWDDSEGKKRYATEVVAEELHFAESKASGGGSASGYSQQNERMPSDPVDGEFYPIDADDELPF